MTRPAIFVSRKIPSPGPELLSESCDAVMYDGEGPPSREELLRKMKDKDGLLCLVTDRVDGSLLDSAPRLKVISSMSVGHEHIDVEAATKRGVYVTYTPGVLTEATADFTFALLLAVARRVAEADAYVREGRWIVAWGPMMMLGMDVNRKTLGIVGLGRIGRAVAQRARGFSMKCVYHDVARVPPEVERELGLEYAPLEQLLAQSDYVTLHVPAMKETSGLMNEAKLRLMKPTAFLINTSRGAVIDESALAKALKEKWIAGAALDVFQEEPLGQDHPLRGFRNVVLAPHLASGSREARSSMAELAARNLLAVLRGEKPPAWVNPEVETKRPLDQVRML